MGEAQAAANRNGRIPHVKRHASVSLSYCQNPLNIFIASANVETHDCTRMFAPAKLLRGGNAEKSLVIVEAHQPHSSEGVWQFGLERFEGVSKNVLADSGEPPTQASNAVAADVTNFQRSINQTKSKGDGSRYTDFLVMIEKPSRNAVEGNFDAQRVIRQTRWVGLVILEQESSEPLTGGSDKTIDCANGISGFLRKLVSVNPSSDSDSKVFVVLG